LRIILLFFYILSCAKPDEEIKYLEVPFSSIDTEDVLVSPERCSYEDCLCYLEIPKYIPQFKTTSKKSYISAYFPENLADLSSAGKEDISSFLKSKTNVQTMLVIGYTDGCGSYSYNKKLSLLRANKVERFLRTKGYKERIIKAGMSEMTEGHSDFAKRVDIITSENFRFQVPPPNLVADFYLLDASGSMSSYKDWVNIISANKKSTSRLYISYTRSCVDGTLANSIRPAGSTEIWWSYWQVLDKMKAGQTLVILSDFNSRYPVTQRERFLFQEKVKSKGVIVYAVQL